MTAIRLLACRWKGNKSGDTYFGLFDQSNVDDAARLHRVKHHPGFASLEIDIDFAQATSPLMSASNDVSDRQAARDLLEAVELVIGSLSFDREDEVNREVLRRLEAVRTKHRGVRLACAAADS